MPKGPSGVRADCGYSHRDLERIAAYVRKQLKFSSIATINPLRLFEGLDDITVQAATGQDISLRGNVVDLEDSEGFTKYDSNRQIIEILASAKTYCWLSLLRKAYSAEFLPEAAGRARVSGRDAAFAGWQ